MDEQNSENIIEFLKKFQESAEDIPKTFGDIEKALTRYKKELDKTQPLSKVFSDLITGTKQPIESMNKTLETFDESIEAVTDDLLDYDKSIKKAELESQRSEIIGKIVRKNALASVVNFGIGVGGVAATMLKGTSELIDGLQGNKEGTELATQAAKTSAQAFVGVATTLSGALQIIGG